MSFRSQLIGEVAVEKRNNGWSLYLGKYKVAKGKSTEPCSSVDMEMSLMATLLGPWGKMEDPNQVSYREMWMSSYGMIRHEESVCHWEVLSSAGDVTSQVFLSFRTQGQHAIGKMSIGDCDDLR